MISQSENVLTVSKCYDLPGGESTILSKAALSKTASGEILTNFCLAFNVSEGSFCFADDLAAFIITEDFSQAYNTFLLRGRKRDE